MSKHTEETKKILSEKRKAYLAANPDKHPWRCSTKFISIPCEKLKDILRNRNILFTGEYQPLIGGKNYSIDIAFPDKLIGIEVNGNQHYERDGTLKPYYKEREKIVEGAGWKLYQIHYSCCFKEEIIFPIIEEILASDVKKDFDYLEYKAKEDEGKEDRLCSGCEKKIWRKSASGLCRKCSFARKPEPVVKINFREKRVRKENPKVLCETKCENCGQITLNKKFCSSLCTAFYTRKVSHPSKEDLERMIWEKPTTILAKELGVSDVAISKWCKRYGIEKPPRGYWEKIYHKDNKSS